MLTKALGRGLWVWSARCKTLSGAWTGEPTVCRIFSVKRPESIRCSLTKIAWDDPAFARQTSCGAAGIGGLSAEAPTGAKEGTSGTQYAGGHRSRVTPVPIPNTEVKPATADGTAWETAWESRSLPAVVVKSPPQGGLLLVPDSDLHSERALAAAASEPKARGPKLKSPKPA